jgi:Glycosyl transferase family 11
MESITSELIGQLGNQLFNWATGYSIAKQNNWQHFVDDSKIKQWGFYLDQFGIKKNGDHIKYMYERTQKSKIKLIRKIGHIGQEYLQSKGLGNAYVERPHHFDPNVLKIGPNKIISGYFQSWKYFESHIDEIRCLMRQNQIMSGNTMRILHSIETENWTGVHVRRSDYLKYQSVFGLTSKEYFARSLEIIRLIDKPDKIIVFSDDTELASLVVPNADSYISQTDIPNPAQNLMLMGRAKSFVGSNSTYSWWGAFQLQSDATIIFPRPWFANKTIEISDLLMPNWISIGI